MGIETYLLVRWVVHTVPYIIPLPFTTAVLTGLTSGYEGFSIGMSFPEGFLWPLKSTLPGCKACGKC